MKKLYWRPKKTPRQLLVILALVAIAGMFAVEHFKVTIVQPQHGIKVKAAELAQKMMNVVKEAKLARGHKIDPEFDPCATGVIGDVMTPVTSVTGVLVSKQTSVNPNFAAVLVDMLTKGGVQPGDQVAIGYSGSFPGFNMAVCAAVETLKLKPVVIASATSSQFGGNHPDLMWIDMERILHDKGLIHFRTCAMSYGGFEDRALRLSDEGRELVKAAIERNQIPLIYEESFTATLDKRMEIYEREGKGAPFKCYINVGGGAVSVGRSLGKRLYQPGLNLKPPRGGLYVDSLLTRFAKKDLPVIHMVSATKLAKQYGIAVAPKESPEIGESNVFTRQFHSTWLAGAMLLGIFGSLYVIVYTPIGCRILSVISKHPPEEGEEENPSVPDETYEYAV